MSGMKDALDALHHGLSVSPDRPLKDPVPDNGETRVQIMDGDPGVLADPDVIVTGFSPGRLAVEGNEDQSGLDSSMESFDIYNVASSWSGSTDIKARRDRVFAMYDFVRTWLQDNPTMDGAVARSTIRTTDLAAEQTSKGAIATLEFVITCWAFTDWS